jgi:chromosome segregation ATPase
MAKDLVTGIKQVLQDILVPEFRALQTEVRHLGERLDRHEQENEKRFAHVDERFESLTREMNTRFEGVHQEIMALAKSMATVDGKLDLLVNHIVNFKEATRTSVRLEQLEKRVSDIDAIVRLRLLGQAPPGAATE